MKLKRMKKPKIVVVMPALNAARTLAWTVGKIPPKSFHSIILVDDKSSDQTVKIAKKLGLKVIALPHNVGYGGNQKVCYLEALRIKADIVVMLHPDGQYESEALPKLVNKINSGFDLVLGSRFLPSSKNALIGGMPRYKFFANRFLTILQNLTFSTNLSEFHTGYRAYNRKFLETVPFLRNSNDFVFDSEILAQAVSLNFKIGEIGVRSEYFKEASSVGFWTSLIYGLKTLGVLLKFYASKMINYGL